MSVDKSETRDRRHEHAKRCAVALVLLLIATFIAGMLGASNRQILAGYFVALVLFGRWSMRRGRQ